MDLRGFSNKGILENLSQLVKVERKITEQVLWYILEVESRRLYAPQGYSSTFDFLTKGCGYSESAAYRRLGAARILKLAPEISEKLKTGALNLSQLARVQTETKKRALILRNSLGPKKIDMRKPVQEALAKIECKNQKQTELILAQEFGVPAKSFEREKIQQDESVRIEVTFTKEQWLVIQKAKEIFSHQNPGNFWNELFVLLAKKEIRRKEGSGNEKDSVQKNVLKDGETDKGEVKAPILRHQATPLRSGQRLYISAHLRHQVFQKSGFQCEFKNYPSGTRCTSKYFLEVDHQKPVAWGGENTTENLRVLCRNHNRYEAERLGLKVSEYISNDRK